MHGQSLNDQRASELLSGWKAIAQHFGRTQSTVRRWAATADLPVYRAAGEKGLSVYAYVDELDAWLTRRETAKTPARADRDPGRPTGDDGSEGAGPAPLEKASKEHRAALARWAVPTRRVASLALALLLVVGIGATAWRQQGEHEPLADATTPVPEEARELYLRGTYLWNRRTPAGIAGAIEALNQAIDIHPDYAEAHAALAITYNLARQYSGMSGWEAYPRAEAAARRAIELNPALDLAQGALAFIEFHWHWRVEAGLARFQEALRLNPESANTLMWYASSLILAGRPEEALPLINRAQALDPHNTTVINMKAQALFYSGQVDEALALVDTMVAEDPLHAWSYYSLSIMHLSLGNYADYLDNYARLGDLIGVPRYRAAAEAGAAALEGGGVEAMAMAMFAVEHDFYERGEALAWDLARHHALLGDRDTALRWLHTSLKRREERLIGIKVDPAFWPISDDQGYLQLIADIGLPADT